jgi:hypothetical protein
VKFLKSIETRYFGLGVFKYNAALICRTTTAFSLCKPPILYEEPITREPGAFANNDTDYFVAKGFKIGN